MDDLEGVPLMHDRSDSEAGEELMIGPRSTPRLGIAGLAMSLALVCAALLQVQGSARIFSASVSTSEQKDILPGGSEEDDGTKTEQAKALLQGLLGSGGKDAGDKAGKLADGLSALGGGADGQAKAAKAMLEGLSGGKDGKQADGKLGQLAAVLSSVKDGEAGEAGDKVAMAKETLKGLLNGDGDGKNSSGSKLGQLMAAVAGAKNGTAQDAKQAKGMLKNLLGGEDEAAEAEGKGGDEDDDPAAEGGGNPVAKMLGPLGGMFR